MDALAGTGAFTVIELVSEVEREEWHSSPADRAHDRERRGIIEGRHGWRLEVFRREGVYGVRETVTSRLPQAVLEARRTVGTRRSLRQT